MNAIVKPFSVLHEVKQIPYWEIESLWPYVSNMINKAVETQDEWSLEGIKSGLMVANGNMQLWQVGSNGAIVTVMQIFQTGKKKCLVFMAGGNDMEHSLHALDDIENWAKKWFGSHKMIIHGRMGWMRVLKDRGYEPVTVCLEKTL